MRQRQCLVLGGLVLGGLVLLSLRQLPGRGGAGVDVGVAARQRGLSAQQQVTLAKQAGPEPRPVAEAGGDADAHPIRLLVAEARRELEQVRRRQSTTLGEAVAEYRRRYGLPPPPHFDKWFALARRRGVQLVDEFDGVHELLTPFWGLRPKTIRARVREALGMDNMLLGLAIRNHSVARVQGGPEWQRNATEAMLAGFLQYLPDMDLAFNLHDEPRVMVPHDDLARLVHKARAEAMPAAAANRRPVNTFSSRPAELADGPAFAQASLSRFNTFAHQATWTHSRMSCPPASPARALDDDDDDRARYALGALGFVYNATAMSDICLSPSVSARHGFFDRPNAFSLVHDLFPVFSQSKISSYSDILYPSPWYWSQQVAYDAAQDRPWADKQPRLYWRGSTTGGWRRQHRQLFVATINAARPALVLADSGPAARPPRWQPLQVPRRDFAHLIDVGFSHVGQCDPADCEAQARFFPLARRAQQHDAWAYKFLLDMDGNAFSGRFYAFLQSRSLTFKLALFREWHSEWLKPWAHYVPLSLHGDDWLEAVRFFAAPANDADAERIAAASRDWASKAVRREDMEVWFFRLLLECVSAPDVFPSAPPSPFLVPLCCCPAACVVAASPLTRAMAATRYARVIDDQRATLGFDLATAHPDA